MRAACSSSKAQIMRSGLPGLNCVSRYYSRHTGDRGTRRIIHVLAYNARSYNLKQFLFQFKVLTVLQRSQTEQ
jgi:hypothetical protein